jgi:hypothetical protein
MNMMEKNTFSAAMGAEGFLRKSQKNGLKRTR